MKGQKELTRKQQKLALALAIAGFAAVMGVLCVVIGIPMVRFASEPERFRAWVENRGIWGEVAYVLMVMLQVIIAIIPGEPLEIAGGYAFGAMEGTLLCLLAGGLGSAVVFGLVRRFGIRLAEVFFAREKLRSLRFLRTTRRRTILFLLIFMIPGTPKDLLCYFAALTDIKLPVLLLICSIGRLPSVITSTVGGNALGTERYLFALIVFLATFVLSIAGLGIYQLICKKHSTLQNEKQNIP